jgi:hypothetical protein
MEVLLSIAETYGLFVALVVYVLWANQRREERYIAVIEKLSKSFEQMKRDLGEIKEKIFKGDDDK